MATIYIDNQPYSVDDGQNLLQACLGLGFDLPYFCWHPAMGSVGACRQCAVKQFHDEKDTHGKIVMACMTPAVDGVRISLDDPEARAFRASVIQWMMINHPHDCPVCDEGGECHLQDMTVMTGHVHRSYPFAKRTFRNQDLGPLIRHEMNRCIHCYRCVRFYCDYAGGRDFGAFAAHDHVYFGRAADGVLENEFSGNLVEVCPTGVFTDKTFSEHFTRKWDLQTAPSICVHCALGCNTIAGGRYGSLRRIRNRYNSEVNGYFLCDRGRFGYEFVGAAARFQLPLARRERTAALETVDRASALELAASFWNGRGRVIGIASPRASLESNFALRSLVGADRFFLGVSAEDYRTTAAAMRILKEGPAPAATLKEARKADAALILGEDVTSRAPMLALSLRQMARPEAVRSAENYGVPVWDDASVREFGRGEKQTLFLATPAWTKLEEVGRTAFHAAPDDLARLGFAVAHRIDPQSPDVPDLSREMEALADEIAAALAAAARPLIVSGTGCGSEAVVQSAANVAWALRRRGIPAMLSLVLPEANSLGLALLGGGDLAAALRMLREGQADTVVILENDLYRRENSAAVDSALGAARHVILIDHIAHATADCADLILPAATFAEDTGTFVSSEGRAQRFFQVLLPKDGAQASWTWLGELESAVRPRQAAVPRFDALAARIAAELPIFGPILEVAPPASFRQGGQKIPRQSPRYSGRTAICAAEDVSEPKPPDDEDSPLAFSMEGDEGIPPAGLITRFWAPGWNSVQALNKFQQEIGGPLLGGDPGRRLVEPPADARPEFFGEVPRAAEIGEGQFLLVPMYHIFGSEILSMLSPAIARLAPSPYVALHPQDAAGRNVAEGELARVRLNGTTMDLPVKVMDSLPPGLAGLPAGLPGMQQLALPARGAIGPAPAAGEAAGRPEREKAADE
jgi:NADH-quinone oxidoreductase subunit G